MPTIVCLDCDHEFAVNIFDTQPRCERCGAREFQGPDDPEAETLPGV